MRRITALILVLFPLLIVAGPNDAVKLRLVSKKGDVFTYRLKMRMEGVITNLKDLPPPKDPKELNQYIEVSGTMREIVTAADVNTFTSRVIISLQSAKAEGIFTEALPGFESAFGSDYVAKVSNIGTTISETHEGDDDGIGGLSQAAQFSPKPVRPGDSWPTQGGAAWFTYWGETISLGKAAFEISGEVIAKVSGETGAIGSVRTFIEKATGRPLSSYSRLRLRTSAHGVMIITISIQRI